MLVSRLLKVIGNIKESKVIVISQSIIISFLSCTAMMTTVHGTNLNLLLLIYLKRGTYHDSYQYQYGETSVHHICIAYLNV